MHVYIHANYPTPSIYCLDLHLSVDMYIYVEEVKKEERKEERHMYTADSSRHDPPFSES